MPLRCLLFSSDEELVPAIWQVLSDLGIDAEYCRSAVEAVERVTTQLFQIVITDWDDQPEAEFLLKTARDQKAATRPLTLAIVKDDASLPTALQAGANSILRKPLAVDQVRDTLSTARDLLRAKQESAKPMARQAAATAAAFAAAAGAGAGTSAPAAITKAPEKPFRAGDFLQPASSDLSRQFDTEPETPIAEEKDAVAEIDPLGELEPMAAAVEAVPEEPQHKAAKEWSSIQARLTRPGQTPAIAPAAKTELLGYEESHSRPAPAAQTEETDAATAPAEEAAPETKAEAELFAYMAGESTEHSEPDAAKPPNRMSRRFAVGVLTAAVIVAVVKIPLAQQSVSQIYGSIVHAGRSWLNPQTVSPPQSPTQHENFGPAGDEYKLPVARNIPDATTDRSQIQVLPVVDPTAKPGNGSATNGAQAQPQAQPTPAPGDSDPAKTGQVPGTEPPSQNSGASAAADPSARPSSTVSSNAAGPAQPNLLPVRVEAPPQHPLLPPQSAPQPRPASVASNAAIPSSLKSQMASLTPEASGTKPAEAALPSIQPVDLPEAAARSLLLQQADPVYPEAAKNNRQQGSVVLQVLIGADGTVRDAKFLQGSLVFARAAIDAVRQWRFRPYLLNGRAAPAQTLLTLNFRPPA